MNESRNCILMMCHLGTTNQEQYLDLGSATLSLWDFFTRSTKRNAISRKPEMGFSLLDNILDGLVTLNIMNMEFFRCFATLFCSIV